MPKPRRSGLGDLISNALSVVGLTEERLSGWLGRPCGCRERREKMNRLGEWARRVISGTPKDEAVGELAVLTEDTTIATTPAPEPPQDT